MAKRRIPKRSRAPLRKQARGFVVDRRKRKAEAGLARVARREEAEKLVQSLQVGDLLRVEFELPAHALRVSLTFEQLEKRSDGLPRVVTCKNGDTILYLGKQHIRSARKNGPVYTCHVGLVQGIRVKIPRGSFMDLRPA